MWGFLLIKMNLVSYGGYRGNYLGQKYTDSHSIQQNRCTLY